MRSKRSAWVQMPAQLRIDPELGDIIRDIAQANLRPVNQQILLWIYQGVQSEKVRKGGEKWGPKLVRGKERRA